MVEVEKKSGKVVIVGAGPVGLWTAIQLLKRDPDLNVTLLERHEQYARSHVLRLDHWSMLLYGRAAFDELEKAFCEEVSGKSFGKMASLPAKSLYIKTNDLEAAMKGYAKSLGAKIELAMALSPEHVKRLHPDASVFIACDGAKSKMREALLPGQMRNIDLQRVVEVKYKAKGDGLGMGALGDHYKTAKAMNFMGFEYVGKPKNGEYPVTVRLFVDEASYEGVGEASFKDPLDPKSKSLPKKIADDLGLYMAARAHSCAEVAVEGSQRVSKLTLSCYANKKFAAMDGDAPWYLTGDAAMGVPYFRALNSGMMLSSRLAQILCKSAGKYGWGTPEMARSSQRRYEFHKSMHVATEFTIAQGKNSALVGYDAWRKASKSKPWQTVKWSESELASIRAGAMADQSGEAREATDASELGSFEAGGAEVVAGKRPVPK